MSPRQFLFAGRKLSMLPFPRERPRADLRHKRTYSIKQVTDGQALQYVKVRYLDTSGPSMARRTSRKFLGASRKFLGALQKFVCGFRKLVRTLKKLISTLKEFLRNFVKLDCTFKVAWRSPNEWSVLDTAGLSQSPSLERPADLPHLRPGDGSPGLNPPGPPA